MGRLLDAAAWVAMAASLALALLLMPRFRDLGYVEFVGAICAVAAAVWYRGFRHSESLRIATDFFAIAFAVRFVATIGFFWSGVLHGDPYGGSPDAWSYDRWARYLVHAWVHGRFPDISAYSLAGRWNVGFDNLLGLSYLVFGESLLVGRVLLVLFGALTTVMLYQVARLIADEKIAILTAILYAFWPLSVGWSSKAVLRDSMVWFLLLAATWLIVRISSGRNFDLIPLLAVLAALRFTRAYAEFIVAVGVALTGISMVILRRKRLLAPALGLIAVFAACEAIFVAMDYPNVIGMIQAYDPAGHVMKRIPWRKPPEQMHEAQARELRRIRGAEPASGVAEDRSVSRDESRADVPPEFRDAEHSRPEPRSIRTEPPSVFGNIVRFTLGPFAWGRVRSYGDAWQSVSMWLWYAIFPLIALGMVLSFRGSRPLRILMMTSVIFAVILMARGRGDAFRQREMIMPVMILAAATGAASARRFVRPIALAYLGLAVLLAAGIVYHRHTVAERRLIGRIDPTTRLERITARDEESAMRFATRGPRRFLS
ncbi:MAG: glycosyltransferase family 39 protein [Thermoanaerobaculia bacterium]